MKKRILPFWYNQYKELIENSIENYLDEYFLRFPNSKPCNDFKEVIKYSVKWWKKIRAILALELFLLIKFKDIAEIKKDDDILKVCIAIEFIHAFSLIHDDLPCMDNDELRRWQLTVWKKYWEYNAVLAWDLLNTLCFEVLSEIKDDNKAKKVISEISKAIWFYWMVWWQIDDLYFETKASELNQSKLIELHNKKTWALIKASIKSGIIIAWKEKYLETFEKFWEKLGLAFQIKDDILDVEWTKEETGKSVWWEEKWFVYFNWLKKSKEKLKDLINFCLQIAKESKSEKLEFLTKHIWERVK